MIQEIQNVSNKGEGYVVWCTANFSIVTLEDYYIPESTFHYCRINYAIEKPNIENMKAEEDHKEVEFKLMVNLKTFTHKIFIDTNFSATEDKT